MSIHYKLFAVAAVAALAIMGCGKKEQHTTAPAATPPAAEAPATGGAPTTPPAQPSGTTGGGAPK
jgi:hypothetical protein